jgi:pseudouridine synthase
MGTLIDPEKDQVTLDNRSGAPMKLQEDLVYILLNKPRGIITSVHDQFDRETVLDRIGWKGSRIYPVGRLDYDTEGLLILTNDGEFAYEMTHPRHQVEKEYHCIVKGIPSPQQLDKLSRGVDIGGFITSPAQVRILCQKKDYAEIQITIKEGKNRQVRRMFEAIGHPVVFLKRERIGNISLGSLKTGEWRRLTANEADKLRRMAGGERKNG